MAIHRHLLPAVASLLLLPSAAAPAAVPAAAPQKEAVSDSQLGFYGVPREAVVGRMRRIGLLPSRPPTGFDSRSDVRTLLESSLTAYLKQAGFEVVGPETYDASYERIAHQLGGLYDTTTGQPKPEQARAALDNARREFVEKDRLDGYAVARIVAAKASFNRDYATWDGAAERSDGQLPPTLLGAFFAAPPSNGTLPAYSVNVSIANTEGKVVFSRSGGVQLAMYYDLKHGKDGDDFLRVPPENLFRDLKRLDRAMHIATLPLLHSGLEIANGDKDPSISFTGKLADYPVPPAGALPAPEPALKVAREQILANVHRIALTTLEEPDLHLPPETASRYMALIREELKPLGWELTETNQAFRALGLAMRAAGSLYDPITGAANTAQFAELRKSVFPGLGMTPPPDAILYVQLIRSAAAHHFGDVQWDGVSQSAVNLGPVRNALFGGSAVPLVGDGGIKTLSLRFQLRDASDTLLYDGRGGVQLLQQLQGKKPTDLAPSEIFKDPAREQPAVHAGLRELVPAPAATATEPHH